MGITALLGVAVAGTTALLGVAVVGTTAVLVVAVVGITALIVVAVVGITTLIGGAVAYLSHHGTARDSSVLTNQQAPSSPVVCRQCPPLARKRCSPEQPGDTGNTATALAGRRCGHKRGGSVPLARH